MKQILFSMLFLLGGLLNGNAQQPSLKFNKDGKFKIVQFTDVHYIHNNPKSAISVERINEVLMQKAGSVLFTGDVIYGKPAEEGMRTILNLAAQRKIPFGMTFGNHDNEQGLTRTQLFDIIRTIPYNLTDSVKVYPEPAITSCRSNRRMEIKMQPYFIVWTLIRIHRSKGSADTITSSSTRFNGIATTALNSQSKTVERQFLHWHSSTSLYRNTIRLHLTKLL